MSDYYRRGKTEGLVFKAADILFWRLEEWNDTRLVTVRRRVTRICYVASLLCEDINLTVVKLPIESEI